VGSGGRILVLLHRDDEAEMVARLLASVCGFEVDLTNDPAAALNHLPGSHVDAVVLGMDLGRERGTRVLEGIRRLRVPAASVPVVLVADEDQPMDRLAGWEAGADGILTKPFHIDDLVAALQTAIRRSPRQRERVRHDALAAARRR
jgi:DNA-binding response OmpR family regulator